MPSRLAALLLPCTLLGLFATTSHLVAQSDPSAVAALFEIESGVVQPLTFSIDPVSAEVSTAVEVEPGVVLPLVLTPHSNRAPDFRVLVDDGSGTLTEVSAPPIRTYRGVVTGTPGSWVRASFDGVTLRATISTPAEFYVVEPTRRQLPSAPAFEHVAYLGKVSQVTGTCGVGSAGTASLGPGGPPSSTISLTEIAIEADFEYYEACGSDVDVTVLDMEDIINSVEGIYEIQVGITYEISRVVVRLFPGLYPSNDSSGRLNQFGAQWSTPPESSIARDVAHLFTGRSLNNGVLGVASIASICNFNAYGLSVLKNVSNYVARVAVTAHELGHNWSASHCNSFSDCRIMCAELAGCGSIDSFAPSTVSSIESFRDTRFCLTFELDPQPLPFVETWETLQVDSSRWTFLNGVGVTSLAEAEPSLPYSLILNANGTSDFEDDEIRSIRLQLDGTTDTTLSFYERAVGVPAGLTLHVDYLDPSLTWQNVTTLVSSGTDPDSFTQHVLALPTNALHNECRIRFRVDVDSPTQSWFLDNISVTEGPPPPLEAPSIFGVSPATGSTNGGSPIIVTGAGFLPDTELFIGGNTVTDLTYVDHFTLLATTPAGPSGDADVEATREGQSDVLVGGFIYSDNSLALSAESVAAGGTVDVTAFATNDVALAGFSLACSFDGAFLDVALPVVDGTDADGAEFVAPNLSNDPADSWWTLGVVLDLSPPLDTVLPPGSSRPIARIPFTAESTAPVGETVTLALVSGVGEPPVDLVFSIAGGTSSTPSTANGAVTVTELGFTRGDVNGDLSIDIADPVSNLNYQFSGGSADCLDALDTNDDGTINIADPVYNLSFLFSGGPEPPQPFPNPGVDPTPDGLGCAGP